MWLKEEWRRRAAACYSLRSYCERSVDQYGIKTSIELQSPSDKWGEGSDPEMIKKKKSRDVTEVPLRRTADGGNYWCFRNAKVRDLGSAGTRSVNTTPPQPAEYPSIHTHTHTNLKSHMHWNHTGKQTNQTHSSQTNRQPNKLPPTPQRQINGLNKLRGAG